MSDKGPRFRFSEDFDLHLAREVYGQNPYEDPGRWGTIQINMLQITGRNVSVRTFRDRIQNLVKKHLVKSAELKGKSGIEINQTEIEDLLQQISEIMSEFNKNKLSSPSSAQKAAQAKSSYLKGYDAREESCSNNNLDDEFELHSHSVEKENNNIPENDYVYVNFNEEVQIARNIDIESEGASPIIEEAGLSTPQKNKTNINKPSKKHFSQANILTPARKRSAVNARQGTVQYLEKKHEKINEIRLKEVALLERKQLLEENKWEIEKQERLKRLELEERRLGMDEKRLKVELGLFSNQQELIKMLFAKKDN